MKATATSAACPACREPMLQLLGVEGVIAVCRACGGFWLDIVACHAVLRDVVHEDAREFAKAFVAEGANAPRAPLNAYREAATVPRACPVCRRDLAATKTRDPIITIDGCPDHGTFFDEQELGTMFRTQDVRRLIPGIEAAEATRELREAQLARRSEGLLFHLLFTSSL